MGLKDNIIQGKEIATPIYEKIEREVPVLTKKPHVAIMRVGEDSSQLAYERSAVRLFERSHITVTCHAFAANVTQEKWDKDFDVINDSEDVTGILVLKPLPASLSDEHIKHHIHPLKDIDCIGLENIGNVYLGQHETFGPCTAEACLLILDEIKEECAGKRVTIVGFGEVVGRPLAHYLTRRGATVTVCHTRTKDLVSETKRADIVIAAAGQAGLITSDHIKEGAIVIDVGINVDENGRLVGDVNFKDVQPKCKAITPVPGGVGTVTNAILVAHAVEAAKKQS